MIPIGPATWSRSLVTAVDLFVGLWLIAMAVLGLLAMSQVDRLGSAGDSMLSVSQEERQLAGALTPLREIPIAGAQIASAQEELTRASAESAADAAQTHEAVDSLGNIAFALVLLLAIFPVFAFYVPMRLMRHASLRAFRPRQLA